MLLFSKSSVAVALFPINVVVVLMPIIIVTVVVFMPIIIVVVIVVTSNNFIVVFVFLPIIVVVVVFQAIRVVDGELVGRAGEPERDDFERRFEQQQLQTRIKGRTQSTRNRHGRKEVRTHILKFEKN